MICTLHIYFITYDHMTQLEYHLDHQHAISFSHLLISRVQIYLTSEYFDCCYFCATGSPYLQFLFVLTISLLYRPSSLPTLVFCFHTDDLDLPWVWTRVSLLGSGYANTYTIWADTNYNFDAIEVDMWDYDITIVT